MSPRPTAQLVIIGDEILSGKVQDANSPWLLRELRRRGVECTGLVVVPDKVDLIAAAVRAASQAADHVFTSGGVGPTHDDVTMAGVARALGVELHEDATLLAFLEARWTRAPGEARRRMAQVPEGAQVESLGHFPQVRVGNVWIFPGVPKLFRNRWLAIADRFGGARPHCAAIATQQSEGDIAVHLEAVLAGFEGVDVGSYPRWDDPDLRVLITLEGADADVVRAATDALTGLLDPERLVQIHRTWRPEDEGP